MRFLVPMLALLLNGCSVLQQLDEWSRPGIRFVDLRDIGPDGLPDAKRKAYADKFILASEVPVDEYHPSTWYSSGR